MWRSRGSSSRPSPKNGAVRFLPRLTNGESLPEVPAKTTDRIIDVKSALAKATKTPAQFMRLTLSGRELNDERLVSDECGFKEVSIEIFIETIVVNPASLFTICNDDELVVEYLVRCRADVDEIGHCGESGEAPLHCAAREGYAAVCRKILELRTPVTANAVTFFERTALHNAARFGRPCVTEVLLADDSGFIAVNAKDVAGMTALHFAALNGHTQVSKAILARPDFAAINEPDGLGRTPLHCAALFGDVEICGKLLEASAVQDTKSSSGHIALDLAKLHGHSNVTELLQKAVNDTACDIQ